MEYIHDGMTMRDWLILTMYKIDTNFASLKLKWDELEDEQFSNHKSHKANFHAWFEKYKAEDFQQSTLYISSWFRIASYSFLMTVNL